MLASMYFHEGSEGKEGIRASPTVPFLPATMRPSRQLYLPLVLVS